VGERDRRIVVEDSQGEKLLRTYLKYKPGIMGHIYNTSYSASGCRKITVRDRPVKSMRPYLKNKQTNEKRNKEARNKWLTAVM
jgi:hypothetical protein